MRSTTTKYEHDLEINEVKPVTLIIHTQIDKQI